MMKASIDTIPFHTRRQMVMRQALASLSHLPGIISKPLLIILLVFITLLSGIIILLGMACIPFQFIINRKGKTDNVEPIDESEKISDPVAYLEKSYAENGAEYRQFLRKLFRYKTRGLERFARKEYAKAVQKIECGNCANCCKTMTPVFRKSDVLRITKALGITPGEYYRKHLIKDESGDYVQRSLPCHFLTRDNKCMIYHVRPDDCRKFPHSSQWFLLNRNTHIQNLDKCPITLNVVENIYELVKNRSKSN